MPAPAPLISTPDEATPEWLTAALIGSGRVPAGARIVSSTPSTIGNGKVGQNVRFELTWEAADDVDVPSSVVGKFASDDPTSRQGGVLTGTYVREARFYQQLSERAGMSVPRCHVAELDMATGEFVLLFDDITPAEAGDQIAGCSVDEAALAMEELARLHTSFWGDDSIRDDSWLQPRIQNGDGLAMLYGMFVEPFGERYADRLSPVTSQVTTELAALVAAWVATDAELPATLLHGDYRLDNMLFGRGTGVPALTTVDWQTPSLGPGPSDASYFLGGGLAVEDRRTHERDLLEVYRRGLVAGGVTISADECWDSYRRNAVAGVHMAVVASMLVGQDPRADEMFLAMAERGAAHVDDLDTLALLG
jgi:hypothetical protein